MLVYLTRRLFWLVITLLVITAITFVIYFVLPPVSPAVLFAGNDPSSTLRSLQGIATIPEFVWELFLGLYCTFKGFRPSSPILQADARGDRAAATPA